MVKRMLVSPCFSFALCKLPGVDDAPGAFAGKLQGLRATLRSTFEGFQWLLSCETL